MILVPLLPLFHRLNREHFESSLVKGSNPIVSIRWSDGRLKSTAGFYRRRLSGQGDNQSEIVLSKPLLSKLPQKALESTLCHEMIHAWVDLILKVREGHGPNFLRRMAAINSSQDTFEITVRHCFPVPIKHAKWLAICPSCRIKYPYKRLVRGAACRKCCNTYGGGAWNEKYLLKYEPNSNQY